MENFKTFIAEEELEEIPYKLVVLSHSDKDDPNETGPLVRKKAKALGLEVYLAELMGAYLEDTDEGKLLYTYPVDEKGEAIFPDMKTDVKYEPPIKMNSEDTLIILPIVLFLIAFLKNNNALLNLKTYPTIKITLFFLANSISFSVPSSE